MKRAVSVSLGDSRRDKRLEVSLGGQPVLIERIGADGDPARARALFEALDGQVDALGVGGVDLYLRLDGREYPLLHPLRMVRRVKRTPLCDGRGLKHTLERRLFELIDTSPVQLPHFQRAFIPTGIDRMGLAEALNAVSDKVVFGDLFTFGIPWPITGLSAFKRVMRLLLPVLSVLPMSVLYGISANPKRPQKPNAMRFLAQLDGQVVITNTANETTFDALRQRGVRQVISTTPRYDGHTFGANMIESMLAACAGRGRRLHDAELDALIDILGLKPTVTRL